MSQLENITIVDCPLNQMSARDFAQRPVVDGALLFALGGPGYIADAIYGPHYIKVRDWLIEFSTYESDYIPVLGLRQDLVCFDVRKPDRLSATPDQILPYIARQATNANEIREAELSERGIPTEWPLDFDCHNDMLWYAKDTNSKSPRERMILYGLMAQPGPHTAEHMARHIREWREALLEDTGVWIEHAGLGCKRGWYEPWDEQRYMGRAFNGEAYPWKWALGGDPGERQWDGGPYTRPAWAAGEFDSHTFAIIKLLDLMGFSTVTLQENPAGLFNNTRIDWMWPEMRALTPNEGGSLIWREDWQRL